MSSSSGQQDRCLDTGGISLPQWMRGRNRDGARRYDFDESSFSPPSHDDSFFCIRYKTSNEKSDPGHEGYKPISQVLNQTGATSGSSEGSKVEGIKNIDFSKHPLPCQQFVPTAGVKETASGPKIKPVKSQGTDDGFHGEPALCGKSIVHVASRIMSRKSGNTVNEQQEFSSKGSKSLPVSPITSPISTPETSPKSQRKANQYFSPTFRDRDKYQAGWLLSSILGQSREAPTGSKIVELEQEPVIPAKYLNRKKSISSQNLSYLGQNEEAKQTVFGAKPSELREMNFWSPTSM